MVTDVAVSFFSYKPLDIIMFIALFLKTHTIFTSKVCDTFNTSSNNLLSPKLTSLVVVYPRFRDQDAASLRFLAEQSSMLSTGSGRSLLRRLKAMIRWGQIAWNFNSSPPEVYIPSTKIAPDNRLSQRANSLKKPSILRFLVVSFRGTRNMVHLKITPSRKGDEPNLKFPSFFEVFTIRSTLGCVAPEKLTPKP